MRKAHVKYTTENIFVMQLHEKSTDCSMQNKLCLNGNSLPLFVCIPKLCRAVP